MRFITFCIKFEFSTCTYQLYTVNKGKYCISTIIILKIVPNIKAKGYTPDVPSALRNTNIWNVI